MSDLYRVVLVAVRDVSERERLERSLREKVILVAVEMPARKLTYTNAGHPSGIVLDASGRVKTYLESTSPPRVVLADAEFPVSGPLQFCQGDCVVMVTDGALEARSANSEPYGLERVIEIVRHVFDRPAEHIVKTLTDDVRSFSLRGELEDGVTNVVLKMV